MTRPYGLLRAGFPYWKTIGRAGVTHPPADLNFGQEGRIYVICHTYTYTIRVINLDDEDLGTFGTMAVNFPTVDDGEFMTPVQLIVDRDERIYVSDEACHRISIMSHEGEFVGKWGEHGAGEGQLDRPSGIAFDADENIFVVDTGNHRVQKFTKDGRYLARWGTYGGGDGELNLPWGIHVDDEGYVYVGDWRNDRVQKFTGGRRISPQLRDIRCWQGRTQSARRYCRGRRRRHLRGRQRQQPRPAFRRGRRIRAAVPRRRDYVKGGSSADSDDREAAEQNPAHVQPRGREALQAPQVCPGRRRGAYVCARLRGLPRSGLQEGGVPPVRGRGGPSYEVGTYFN